jgi:CheY-like chemotaxis protein
MLQRLGHNCVMAANGREALMAFAATTFDLILMDIQMPEMDGLEATRRIREQERRTGKRVPIIAVTANSNRIDREQCYEAGMDGCIFKPVRLDELEKTIERAFEAGKAQ